jgi:uncharacterized protein YegL
MEIEPRVVTIRSEPEMIPLESVVQDQVTSEDSTDTFATPNSLQLHFLIDKSGSMQDRVRQVETGYLEFLQHQKSIQTPETDVFVNTVFFSHHVESLLEKKPLEDVAPLEPGQYQPNGSTALYDAMGATLTKIKEEGAPGVKHVVIVLTDGEENSSVRYNSRDVSRLIQDLKETAEIVYMGSNQDAILQGGAMGLEAGNTLDYNDENILDAIRSTTRAVGRMRSGESRGIEYTTLERNSSMGVGVPRPRMSRNLGGWGVGDGGGGLRNWSGDSDDSVETQVDV